MQKKLKIKEISIKTIKIFPTSHFPKMLMPESYPKSHPGSHPEIFSLGLGWNPAPGVFKAPS